MLVISRAREERFVIKVPPSDREQVIVVQVCDVRGDKVRLGIAADRSIKVLREELRDRGVG